MENKQNDRPGRNKPFIAFMAVFLGILTFRFVESILQSTDSPTITTYTTPLVQNKPTTDKPVEPYFVYEGTLDLEKLKRDEELLLCQGVRACMGVYWDWKQILRKEFGPPTTEFKFDDARDSESNRGDFFAGWVLSDGYEIALLSRHQNYGYWQKRGKYPEVVILLRDPR